MSEKLESKDVSFGYGFLVLLKDYGQEKGSILILLHKRLGELLDNRRTSFRTKTKSLSIEDIQAIREMYIEHLSEISNIRQGGSMYNSVIEFARSNTTLDQSRWANSCGLVTNTEYLNMSKYMNSPA